MSPHRRLLARARRTGLLALRPWNRHSLSLATLGSIYIAIGLVWVLTPAPNSRQGQLAVLLVWSGGDISPWGMLWVLAGGLTLISTRWPPPYPRWGYVACGYLAGFGAAVSLAGPVLDPWLHTTATWGIGLAGLLVWGGFAFLLWVIAGLTAPIIRPPDSPEQ